MVSEAGLKCISLYVYDTAWPFPDASACADAMFEAFNFRKYVPETDTEDFKADMARVLNGGSTEEHREFSMKSILYCVHAQSAGMQMNKC
ncbi:hypothetical protein V5799_016962 [Amblyomma americanum]|uniref:Uncharacterized protein n=1 Tax=Amblyomma americanum TaxID=6943 RepID=A0AAQ4F3N9_AMBAM